MYLIVKTVLGGGFVQNVDIAHVIDINYSIVGRLLVVIGVGLMFGLNVTLQKGVENNILNFRISDYASKKETIHHTKLPTLNKSKVQYCRNCNCKNKDSAKVCVQCEVTLREPHLRRKMR